MPYADVSELHALEPVGLPDEAWQRLYERIAQQRGPAESCGSSQVPISLYCLSKFVTLLGAVAKPGAASTGLLERRCCLCSELQGGEDNRTVVSLALALQMLKKGNEDLLQIFMSGAPEPGSVQQVASYLGQSEGNGASSKLRGAATTSAGALAC